MTQQYTAHPEEFHVDVEFFPVSSTFEELYVQEDLENDISADSVWNLSDDSVLFFGGFESSINSSDMSDFTSFSDLGYNENPSSIFYQSLGIFDEVSHSAAEQGQTNLNMVERGHIAEKRIPDDFSYQHAPGQVVDSVSEYDKDNTNPEVVYENESPMTIRHGHNVNISHTSPERQSFNDNHDYNHGHGGNNVQNGNPNRDMTANQPEGNKTDNHEEKEAIATIAPISIDDNVQAIVPDGYIDPTHTNGKQPNWNGNNGIGAESTAPTTWDWQSLNHQTTDCSGVDPALTMGPPVPHPASLTANSSTEAVERITTERDTAEKDPPEEDLGDESAGRRDRRKAKPIAKRFQPLGNVTVSPSYVQCLNIVLDYNGYTGTITKVVLNNAITNIAYSSHDTVYRASLMRKPLYEFYPIPENEELVGSMPIENSANNPILIVSGILQRKIHFRDISSIIGSVGSITYVKSARFNIHNPYEPQFYRYELDAKGKVVNESKCGLCAFCPTVKFLPFKNSSYLSHMTLEHGIFASNFVVPEGLYYGRYRMIRATDPSKTRTVKALQCPACFQVIEVACWKNKSNPLLSYFRHFKKLHSNLNKTFMTSTIDPVMLKHRGGNFFKDANYGLPPRQ